jgi:hypothetical protein
MLDRLRAMERLLGDSCRCRSLDECGERLRTLECAQHPVTAAAPRGGADLLNLGRGKRP